MLALSINISGEWLKGGEATQRTIPVDLVERSLADRQWIQVHADTEYFLKINLKSPGKNKKVRSKDMIPFAKYIVMHCAIWYHLYDLKNVKNTHGKKIRSKSTTPPWVFFIFFKFYKWYQLVQRITYIEC